MSFDLDSLKSVLYTAVLSDTLDGFGLMNQAMKPFVRPLDEDLVMLGRARTGLYAPVTAMPAEGENPYELEMALIDDLKAGEVAVLACGGPTDSIAPWGELLSTASRYRGAAGCVTDGLVRDIRQIRQMSFPVFHGGIGPLDSKGRGKMVQMDGPVTCAGVTIHPGDLVFGDCDGVVVIPNDIAPKVIEAALAKITGEDSTRDELSKGATLAQVYAKYGVL